MTQTIPQAAKPGINSSASLRCSRPLCSSQNTGGTPCNPIQRSDHTRVRRPRYRSSYGPEVGNSIQTNAGRSLRTQQRAKDQAALPQPFQSKRHKCRSDVLGVSVATWSQCQCSTHERHRKTCVSEMATRSNSAVYRRILECSLERR